MTLVAALRKSELEKTKLKDEFVSKSLEIIKANNSCALKIQIEVIF